jgi:hypothetical protein
VCIYIYIHRFPRGRKVVEEPLGCTPRLERKRGGREKKKKKKHIKK